MTDQLFFSIIIPLYNKAGSIAKTIKSVIQQSYPNFELIVVDDGSTDGSAEVVENIPDERIRLIKQSNAGVSAARNRGIGEARYDFIAFLDADDFWEPDYLEEMSGFIKLFPDASMYGCAFDEISGENRKLIDFHLSEDFKGIIDNYFINAKKNYLFWPSAVIIKKILTSKSGFFDESISLGEDLDYFFRIAYNHKVAFYNKVLAHYNLGAENRGMNKKHTFSKSILWHTSKYLRMEQESPAFKAFINLFRLQKIPELFSDYDIGKREIKEYLEAIDPHGQKLKHRVFLKMPFAMQSILIKFLK